MGSGRSYDSTSQVNHNICKCPVLKWGTFSPLAKWTMKLGTNPMKTKLAYCKLQHMFFSPYKIAYLSSYKIMLIHPYPILWIFMKYIPIIKRARRHFLNFNRCAVNPSPLSFFIHSFRGGENPLSKWARIQSSTPYTQGKAWRVWMRSGKRVFSWIHVRVKPRHALLHSFTIWDLNWEGAAGPS